MIEPAESDGLTDSLPQVEAGRELQRVTRTQRMAHQQRAGAGGDGGHDLDDGERGQIGGQCGKGTIPFRRAEGSLAPAADQGGGQLDLG